MVDADEITKPITVPEVAIDCDHAAAVPAGRGGVKWCTVCGSLFDGAFWRWPMHPPPPPPKSG